MTARNDLGIPQYVQGASLAASGTAVLGAEPIPIVGTRGFSITASTPAGSTAAGSIAVQCTDIKADATGPLDPNIPWAPMNYPGTSTAITLTLVSGANAVNVQVPNAMCKMIRLVYTASSGTGTLNVGVTGRAISHS